MDNLTHGLLGLATGAVRRPDGGPGTGRPASATDKAVLLAAVLAAQLPDLDSLWPSPDDVMNALQAHRGFSHSLFAAPMVALAAAGAAALLFRGARFRPVYVYSLISVIVAHLIPDLWTGWGTRVLLPFSYERFAWDWTMVVDPFVTMPLLAGAGWAFRRRGRWRRAILAGALAAALYVLSRGAIYLHLDAKVAGAYPGARSVQVFPSWLGLATWRYVAVFPAHYAVGSITLGQEPAEQKRVPAPPPDVLAAEVRAIPTVREALAWARFPVVGQTPGPDGSRTVTIADLRYHLRGEPTLTFVLQLSPENKVKAARLDRGGSPGELLRRYRK